MNLVGGGFLSGSIVIGGLDPGAASNFVVYASPQSATLLPDDAVITDVSPQAATILPDDVVITDVSPQAATILH